MRWTLRGARLVDGVEDVPAGDIAIADGRIVALEAESDQPRHAIDATGTIVLPGFVEVHTHGGGGYSLHTTDEEELLAYARWLPSTGATSFLVGVVGVADGLPERQIRAAVVACRRHEAGAEPLGIYLEGPYISARRRGAHAKEWLRRPDADETRQLIGLSEGWLHMMTLAPELPGAHVLIRQLTEAGVTAAIGHSDATYEQALEALALGATHITHCYNAMRPLLHRAPGPLGALVEASRTTGELIADGVHVHPAAMKALVRALTPERTVVITDAMAGAGVPDMVFTFAGQEARVVDGAARLADGTISGSVLTMDQALHNVLRYTGVSLSDAVRMLTANPAEVAGAADRKGRLAPGYDADLALFDADLTLQATLCQGHLAYATEEWRERLHGVIA